MKLKMNVVFEKIKNLKSDKKYINFHFDSKLSKKYFQKH